MKKIKSVAIALRDLIRGRKFISRTIISCACTFLGVLAFGIAWDAAYRFAAVNSGVILAAVFVGGQCFLYSRELSRIKAWFVRVASDPASATAAEGKAKAPREKAPKPSAAASFAQVARDIVDEFNPTNEYDDEDDDDNEEEFED